MLFRFLNSYVWPAYSILVVTGHACHMLEDMAARINRHSAL